MSGIFALLGGTILGIYTAIRLDGWIANLVISGSLIGVSLLTFLIGNVLIYLFSVELDVLPSFGRGEVVDLGRWNTGFLILSGLKALLFSINHT